MPDELSHTDVCDCCGMHEAVMDGPAGSRVCSAGCGQTLDAELAQAAV
jgi:hypothetical protein